MANLLLNFIRDSNAKNITQWGVFPRLSFDDIISFYQSNIEIANWLDGVDPDTGEKDYSGWRYIVDQKLDSLIEEGDVFKIYRIVRANSSLKKILTQYRIWDRLMYRLYHDERMEPFLQPETGVYEYLQRIFNGYPNPNPLWIILSCMVYETVMKRQIVRFGKDVDDGTDYIAEIRLQEDMDIFVDTTRVDESYNLEAVFAELGYQYTTKYYCLPFNDVGFIRRVYLLFKAGLRLVLLGHKFLGYGSKAVSKHICSQCDDVAEWICGKCEMVKYCSLHKK